MLMDETPFYYAALVLHPFYKMAWLRDEWRQYPALTKTVSNRLKDLVAEYGREYKNTQTEMREKTTSHGLCLGKSAQLLWGSGRNMWRWD